MINMNESNFNDDLSNNGLPRNNNMFSRDRNDSTFEGDGLGDDNIFQFDGSDDNDSSMDESLDELGSGSFSGTLEEIEAIDLNGQTNIFNQNTS